MSSSDIITYGPWVYMAYKFIFEELPKYFPRLEKVLSKRASNEDRLFKIIDDRNQVDKELGIALAQLSGAIETLSHRVEKIEDFIKEK